MKSKIVFGALLLSAALCAQGFCDDLQCACGLHCGACGSVRPPRLPAANPRKCCARRRRPAAEGLLLEKKCCCTPGPRLVLRTEGHLRVQVLLQVRDLRPGEVLCPRALLLQAGVLREALLLREAVLLQARLLREACLLQARLLREKPCCCEKPCLLQASLLREGLPAASLLLREGLAAARSPAAAKPRCCEKTCGCGCEKCCCHPLKDLLNDLFCCKLAAARRSAAAAKPAAPACGCCGCGGGAPAAAPSVAPPAPEARAGSVAEPRRRPTTRSPAILPLPCCVTAAW